MLKDQSRKVITSVCGAAAASMRAGVSELVCPRGEARTCHAAVRQGRDIGLRVADNCVKVIGQPFMSSDWIGPVTCFGPSDAGQVISRQVLVGDSHLVARSFVVIEWLRLRRTSG